MPWFGARELADHAFIDRLQRHRREFLDSDSLEAAAAQLAGDDFRGTRRFLRQVCRWGGYYGIAVRVAASNPDDDIRNAFSCAHEKLERDDPVAALRAINRLRGLGRPAFASKFLRFMRPQSAAILDSVISRATGFRLNVQGYANLLQACHGAAAHLAGVGVLCPIRPNGQWYVADIEAALYADIIGLES